MRRGGGGVEGRSGGEEGVWRGGVEGERGMEGRCGGCVEGRRERVGEEWMCRGGGGM